VHPVVAIGHSNQEPERFLESLRAHAVRLLVDIRRFPGSRRVAWASRDRLPELLAGAGIGYLHAPDLGGRRTPVPGSPNTGWRNEAFRGYADHMASPEFQAALDRLLALARQQPVAIMCAEAVPWRCHRSLVADALVARGAEVVQVLSPTQAKPHRMTPFARVKAGQVTYPAERPLM
jgi:uncharacterized protein (DUF488 family)